ncbi:MAG TPA: HDOD domain-containing protein [Acidiferrobacteraceae bacterium]|nr:HDOD domain-containing protein [Acidiferrobacteraceae bacterium]
MSKDKNSISLKVLETLVPINEFSYEGKRELAGKTVIEEQQAGRTLITQGAVDHWTYYLLQGEIELTTSEGTKETLLGNDEQARLPLDHAHSGQVAVVTKTAIRFIRIDSDLLEVLLGEGRRDNLEVEEIQAQDALAENQVFNQIYHEYMNDALILPGIPDIALRVREVTQDPRNGIDVVAKVVQMDPALTARLIQVANSPFYRGQDPIDNCRAAITRLGLHVIRNLVMNFSLHNVFRTQSSLLKKRMAELWEHSSRVAAISYVLAGHSPGFDANHAMLAGLVHDIGVLPVISHVEAFPELASNPEDLDKAIEALRPQVGAMVLRKWRFGSDLVQVALEAEDWDRDPDTQPDYCDIVLMAQLHSFIGIPHMHEYPHVNTVPAFHKLLLGELSPQMSLAILEEAAEDVAEALQLLKA